MRRGRLIASVGVTMNAAAREDGLVVDTAFGGETTFTEVASVATLPIELEPSDTVFTKIAHNCIIEARLYLVTSMMTAVDTR